MKRAPKYLKFYMEFMKNECLPAPGLCNSLGRKDDLLKLFTPDVLDDIPYNYSPIFWGSGVMRHVSGEYFGFTPLRQTIVLFLAAMNDEL